MVEQVREVYPSLACNGRKVNTVCQFPGMPISPKGKWSPQQIIECIRLRHQEGKPVHYNAVHVDANSGFKLAVQ